MPAGEKVSLFRLLRQLETPEDQHRHQIRRFTRMTEEKKPNDINDVCNDTYDDNFDDNDVKNDRKTT